VHGCIQSPRPRCGCSVQSEWLLRQSSGLVPSVPTYQLFTERCDASHVKCSLKDVMHHMSRKRKGAFPKRAITSAMQMEYCIIEGHFIAHSLLCAEPYFNVTSQHRKESPHVKGNDLMCRSSPCTLCCSLHSTSRTLVALSLPRRLVVVANALSHRVNIALLHLLLLLLLMAIILRLFQAQ
jgi:hypothetical protein